ncbi:nucleoside deaminase [Gracilibacillus alcaliphilus]|uniref:nucleoside deaminase n=1 Tax=Gracilibacillus alcaliphilus TaxID=1401441 RepID=UPI00195BF535|nr:nucleoside deaminase [Gracilibacillus alcaliphilus]MBM7678805.1 tRNA(Arg) A34 adenosine deaminase TadA [Gracilibacillus alcaliphilus]
MDYLQQAVKAAKEDMKNGGGPFGAVIVKEDQIVAAVGNTVTSEVDPTAHAELRAVRVACQKLGTLDLSECEMYTTCEPCPMCLGAILWANIKKVYYHSTHEDASKNGFSAEKLISYFNGEKSTDIEFVQICDHKEAEELWGTN